MYSKGCIGKNKAALVTTSVMVCVILVLAFAGMIVGFNGNENSQNVAIISLVVFLLSIFPTIVSIMLTSNAYTVSDEEKARRKRRHQCGGGTGIEIVDIAML
jgi:hypothetical protein